MEEDQAKTLRLAQQILGKWRGEGVAEYPTIQTFIYREEIKFSANQVQPLLHYNQRTWKKLESGEFVPSHWETGFWRVLPAGENSPTGQIEVLCAQSGGRVEVLHGVLAPEREGFVLRLHSELVANDSRVENTSREFVLSRGTGQGETLRYTMEMKTTKTGNLILHVHADLKRLRA
jgi:hypothetical protein